MWFVFLTVMASIPLMLNIIKEEEKKDLQDLQEVVLLKEHAKALYAFMALFLGITLGVVATYAYTPLAIGLAFFFGIMSFVYGQNNYGYWQQHVDYTMDVKMDVDTFSYGGTQKLIYTNNSPDDISYVIPGNDDSSRAIRLYARGMADAVLEGKSQALNELAKSVSQEEEFVEVTEAVAE